VPPQVCSEPPLPPSTGRRAVGERPAHGRDAERPAPRGETGARPGPRPSRRTGRCRGRAVPHEVSGRSQHDTPAAGWDLIGGPQLRQYRMSAFTTPYRSDTSIENGHIDTCCAGALCLSHEGITPLREQDTGAAENGQGQDGHGYHPPPQWPTGFRVRQGRRAAPVDSCRCDRLRPSRSFCQKDSRTPAAAQLAGRTGRLASRPAGAHPSVAARPAGPETRAGRDRHRRAAVVRAFRRQGATAGPGRPGRLGRLGRPRRRPRRASRRRSARGRRPPRREHRPACHPAGERRSSAP
jgi:hypothetical protein